ncbi:phytanoyl-CoA dioxygenase family protein [Gordonia rhizosphera]|uniref:Phytanoyl-CoA dioxygenase family protein n=1 Tax=Gordonia rhizosphera NBRC 16068 TaxID=1108045 RepID=K6WE69_9ACTN|nr:phytanoyl-CoA dioxygenase family protein [Gordonia rhizosphera]GAB92046.1 phytanoyl-CoA dioxygenase family protein [Gordonia rhizosphera NBRC 16068]
MNSSFQPDIGVFTVDEAEALAGFYRSNGFATVRGLLDESTIAAIERECVEAQHRVVAGELPSRYGSVVFLDDAAKAQKFGNYVEYVNELAPSVREALADPRLRAVIRALIGETAWLRDGDGFGVVYQDARPGRESGYSRIGWHSDWQSSPSLDIWPSTAFTIHIDATSPANGFLRVVPGSHLWSTPAPFHNINDVPVPDTAVPARGWTDEPPPFAMPLGFDKVPGEIGVYLERGDVLLHDGYLWHSAARATDDDTSRRHVRGGFFAGARPAVGAADEFVKNAAR